MNTESRSASPSSTPAASPDATPSAAEETAVATPSKKVHGFTEQWLPSQTACVLVCLWLIGTLIFGVFVAPKTIIYDRDRKCPFAGKTDTSPLSAEMIGTPPADATLHAKLGIERGPAIATTSWPSGPGAPEQATVQVKSSALRKAGGASVIEPEAVTALAEINSGTTLLRVCIANNSDQFVHGQFNGFVSITTADPAKPLTVREQLSIQSAYVVDFWPLIFVMVPFALAVASKKLSAHTKPARWLILFTGAGAFVAAYRANALSNITWGGFEDIGSLIAATFTATTGAVAAAAAATSQGTTDEQVDSR